MILQALVSYYEALANRGEIARPGWNAVKVPFALCIDGGGELQQVISLQTEAQRGKKTVLVPRVMQLPAPVKRTVGVSANFLADNSSYLLGMDGKGNPARTQECFSACKALHQKLLETADSPAARALLAFFRRWDPSSGPEHPALLDLKEEILKGGNLIFRCEGKFVHEDAAVRQAWQRYYDAADGETQMACLVTGQTGPVAQLHPSIKGVQNAQSSGASLVSFNSPSFCSYDKEQGSNAPTSAYAAFAYGAALNYLLASKEHTFRIGDATVTAWAEGGAPAYGIFFAGMMSGSLPSYSERDLLDLTKNLAEGKPVDFLGEKLSPTTDFYILGLAPNSARLSVRFFLHNSFGEILKNVQAHYERLEIVRPDFDSAETIPLWQLLSETVNQNARDKTPSPGMAGETFRAILTGTPYPATLLNGVTLRIRAERNINRRRATILKAYYLKRSEHRENPDIPKEVLTVSLNPDSNNVPYVLGRAFSVLEDIQASANPAIKATIKDKYFNSAAATPAAIFPILGNLAQKHLRKLKGSSDNSWKAKRLERQLGELLVRVGTEYPTRLTLPQQGAFQLGYYHETQARYQKKEDTKNAGTD